MFRKTILAVGLIAVASPTFAQGLFQGTAQEQAACRPDTRKLCYTLKAGTDSMTYLSCLKANRSKLSRACLAVLERHGQ